MLVFKKFFYREVLLNFGSFNDYFSKCFFFAIIITIFSIGIGADQVILEKIGNTILWVALLLSLIPNFDRIFTEDLNDGWLEQILISKSFFYEYIFAKCFSVYLFTLVPFLVICPIVFFILNIPIIIFPYFFSSFCLVLGSLVMLGALSSSLTIGSKISSIISVILIIPISIPILIFGILSTDKDFIHHNFSSNILLLGGVFLIFLIICPFAICEGLKIAVEEE